MSGHAKLREPQEFQPVIEFLLNRPRQGIQIPKRERNAIIYKVSFKMRIQPAKVNVKLKGAFEGSKTLRFTINPKGTSISTVSSKSKGFAPSAEKRQTIQKP